MNQERIALPKGARSQSEGSIKELDYRNNAGLEVTLFWNQGTNSLKVTVLDVNSGVAFELPAHPKNASDVFRHPFAYAEVGNLAAAEYAKTSTSFVRGEEKSQGWGSS